MLVACSRSPSVMGGVGRCGTAASRLRLRSALTAYQGSSLRGLLAPLRPVAMDSDAPALSPAPPESASAEPGPWFDCDTAADLVAARRAWLASAYADLKGEA